MDKDRQTIFEGILKILVNYTDKQTINQITPQFSINKTIGLHGDDANLFIKEYSVRFNVNVSEFKFEKYFYEEGTNILDFHKLLFERRKNKIELSIDQLIDCVISGKLF